MNKEVKTLILYRLERAHEALDEALILLEKGYANTFVNRLYYACFYAVSALLLQNDLIYSRHTGVRACFSREFVSKGLIPKDYGKLYSRLFKYRQQSDYEDFFTIEEDIVKGWISQSDQFISAITELLDDNDNLQF